jgi:hypothetical protein
MIDRHSKGDGEGKRHLEESLASGRVTRFEADVIEPFFATPPSPDWPASGLQRRMQASGKPEPLSVWGVNTGPDHKPKA